MDLYDIHTHDPLTTDLDDDVPKQNVTYILNVYPLEFEYTKDSDQCEYFSCGIHPWHSENPQSQINFLKEIATDNRIVAIGEAGFDKIRGSHLDIQAEVFVQQIELSEKLHKPLIIHCVKAWDELLNMKKKYKPQQPWIIHGYRGKQDQTKQLLMHGFYFSIGERFNIDSLRTIPLNRLFCETDDSDISIESIYTNIANILNIDMEFLATEIDKNIKNVFPLINFTECNYKDIPEV